MAKTISTDFITDKINGIAVNTSLMSSSKNYNNSSNRSISYIVMHYTGNSKDTAWANANYFNTGSRGASAHFFVDDDRIYQSVELRDIAWHCGADTYYHDICRNTNSIGIEMCCTAGNYKISETTKKNAAYLCAHLCKMIGITANQVDTYILRHYDVTHKQCPAQMSGSTNSEWVAFKTMVKNILNTGKDTIVAATPITSTGVRIGHASRDENNKTTGGSAGDQTEREVRIDNYYVHSKGWVVLRCKDDAKREKIAQAMEKACKNNQIGYDQNQRSTLFNNVKNSGFDPSKTTKNVEVDCSALVRVCVAYAYGSDKTGDIRTAYLPSTLVETGLFTEYTSDKYCKSSDYLRRGDILCTPVKGHTVVVLDDGAKAKKTATTTNSVALTTGARLKLSKVALYASSSAKTKASTKTGTFYVWSKTPVNNRIRITNSSVKVGKAGQVTGWISVDDAKESLVKTTTTTTTFKSYKVKVTAKDGLNIRKGASTSYAIVGALAYGKTVTISKESNGWGYVSGKGWISLTYTKKV